MKVTGEIHGTKGPDFWVSGQDHLGAVFDLARRRPN